MKKLIIGISAVFMIVLAESAMAQGMSHDMDHGMAMEEGHSMQQTGSMGGAMEGMGSGEMIHAGVVEGYHFSYHLMDIREKMEAMKAAGHGHEGINATHHLMVYIEDPNGATIENAQVGYFIEGSDGTTQKLMCMGMGGGFGSDVNLGDIGEYLIQTKVVAGEIKLIDSFSYPEN